MSPFRPDLVDCWIVRVHPGGERQTLLIRRAPGRILPGLWQCVSGSIEPGERVAIAALREVDEETGYDATSIERFYDLDLVNQFHEPSVDAVLSSAVFAVLVRADVEPRLSREHDGARWVALEAAESEVVWPGYHEAIARVRQNLFDPDRAPWFELDLAGARVIA